LSDLREVLYEDAKLDRSDIVEF